MPLTMVTVREIEVTDINAIKSGKPSEGRKAEVGLSLPNSSLIFEKGEGSTIFLAGKAKGKVQRQSIINPDWDFSKMGIGGLDTQFNAIFRRAFASRVFPPEIMEQLGCKHVKGQSEFLAFLALLSYAGLVLRRLQEFCCLGHPEPVKL